MATRQSINEMIAKTDNVLSQAHNRLDQANQNGYEINALYDQTQLELNDLEIEITKLMHSANHQQKEQLYRLRLRVNSYLNDMILDTNQLID